MRVSFTLALRGAERRGDPFSFLGWVRIRDVARGNGLPRQCAHWPAMTGETGTLSLYLSLRGAERRGNPFSFWWRVRGRDAARGKRIAAPVCATSRNDRNGEGGRVGFAMVLRGRYAHWVCDGVTGKLWGVMSEEIATPACGLVWQCVTFFVAPLGFYRSSSGVKSRVMDWILVRSWV